MRTDKVYIAHNEYCHALPEAISQRGTRITFYLDKISDQLKARVFGTIGVIELTEAEMTEIVEAKRAVTSVTKETVKRIFNIATHE
jgi:hypothetical protein